MAKPKFNIDNVTDLTTESKQETKKATTKIKTETKVVRTKSQEAYLKVDLRPVDCPDLKDYVVEQASELSKKEKKSISTTAYIQRVLIADKEKHTTKKGANDDILEMIDSLDKNEIKAVRTLLESMTKGR